MSLQERGGAHQDLELRLESGVTGMMWLVALSWPERAKEAVSSKMGFHGAKCYTLSCGPRPDCLSKDEVTVQGEGGPGAFISHGSHVPHEKAFPTCPPYSRNTEMSKSSL